MRSAVLHPPDPPTAARPQEWTGVFDVEGHRVRLRTRYWPRPPVEFRLLERWRAWAAGAAFFHVQQAGSRPTFVGVACADPELGRQFTLELLCGGWGWHDLRRHHALFQVGEAQVRVYQGPRGQPAPALAELASGHVLPRARDHVARRRAERQRQQAMAARLAGDAWLEARCQIARSGAEPCLGATACREGRTVLVTGCTETEEAVALAQALAAGPLWSPERHGHLHVHFGTAALELALERPQTEAEPRLRRFISGFARHVVLSDLHLGLPPRDTFGTAKGQVLAALIRQVIRDRSTLVLNGDFLELLHERYGDIRRAYPEVFGLLPSVRRLLYVAGNHDDGILRENIKQTRRATRNLAARHAYARVWIHAQIRARPVPLRADHRVRRAGEWNRLLAHPDLLPILREILLRRRGSIWLSRGFAGESIAFRRLGPRDTDAEQPQWYFDESLLDHPDPVAHLRQLLADRRQRLDEVLRRDWGHHLRILRYHWDAGRGLYCEHGHFAVPECHGNRLGRAVGVAAGWGKRAGLRQVEHWFEERLGGWLRAIHPFDILRQIRQFTERQLAVATALSRLGGSARPPTIVCSHTHEVAAVGVGPVHASLHAATGATYANTGAWSSRFRLKRSGDTRVEWLEVGAHHEVRPRLALVPAIVRARPLLSRLLTPFAGKDPQAESRHLDSYRNSP
ncbi:MAG: hypothetical protein HS113_23745 [Verrucomicrobiales bacterium]|nr:hypothetical protein [Verrucomicrobiales bacterium]